MYRYNNLWQTTFAFCNKKFYVPILARQRLYNVGVDVYKINLSTAIQTTV